MNLTLKDAGIIWDLVGFRKPLILASSSPRRAEILRNIGCPFEVVPPDYVESEYKSWDGGELLFDSAVQKAENVRTKYPDRAVLAADTIVRRNEAVFGKPRDRKDAVRMLKALAGRKHEVWSAICYLPEGSVHRRADLCSTEVSFRSIGDREIAAYVETGEPLDKAGAYGIQGVGGLWIEERALD
jgi:septum formation protein